MTKTDRNNSPWLGASWKIAAFACYAILNGIVRYICGGADTGLSNPLSVNMVIFTQDLIALLILLPLYRLKGNAAYLPKSHWALHIFRGVFSTTAVVSWYYAIKFMPIAEAVALSIIGPLFGVLGASVFLGEKIDSKRLSAILLSFLMASYVIHPGSAFIENQNNLFGLACVLGSSLFFAIAKISTRKLAKLGCSPHKLTCSLLQFVVPMTFVIALGNWQWPVLMHLPWLVLGGVLTAAAIYCVSSSLYHAEVSSV
jgi:drug/metabolite transporter (DMT)-like permease